MIKQKGVINRPDPLGLKTLLKAISYEYAIYSNSDKRMSFKDLACELQKGVEAGFYPEWFNKLSETALRPAFYRFKEMSLSAEEQKNKMTAEQFRDFRLAFLEDFRALRWAKQTASCDAIMERFKLRAEKNLEFVWLKRISPRLVGRSIDLRSRDKSLSNRGMRGELLSVLSAPTL